MRANKRSMKLHKLKRDGTGLVFGSCNKVTSLHPIPAGAGHCCAESKIKK
jgi:hypothetical protein